MKYKLKIIAIILTFFAGNLLATELTIPGHLDNTQQQIMPKRGWDKSKVLDVFGEPAQRIPAVGIPAISEWDFGSFRVYFEDDIVLHSLDLNSLIMPSN